MTSVRFKLPYGVVRPLIALLIYVPILLPAVGASRAFATPSNAASHVLTIAMAGDVETLDSAFSHFQRSNEVSYNTHDRFFQYGTRIGAGGVKIYNVNKIKPEAVASWHTSPNGKTIVLNLRRNARFSHTGDQVTAKDFYYWFQRAFKSGGSVIFNLQTSFIKSMQSVKVTGPYQLTIHFSKPSPLFFYLFRDQAQGPIEAKVYKSHATKSDPWATHWAAKHDAGSGPYYVQRSVPGVETDLAANPYYSGKKPYFSRVILKVIPSDTDRVLLLQRGSVDVSEELSTDEMNQLRKAPGVKVLSVPTRNQIMVGLNAKMKPTNNTLVRQALAYAVPYSQIVKAVYGGHALQPDSYIPLTGQFHASGMWPYTFDLAKAKQLLKQAGYPNGFDLNLDIQSGNATFEEMAILLQSTWAKLGVKVNIVKQPAAVFANGTDKQIDQAWLRDLLFYVDDPGYAGDLSFRCTAVLNWTGYCNHSLDKAVVAMDALWRPAQRARKAALARQYQQILASDVPALLLVQTNFELATRQNIHGYLQEPDNLLYYYTLYRSGS
jgi:peptide/nickel transport system substrate-binding protein